MDGESVNDYGAESGSDCGGVCLCLRGLSSACMGGRGDLCPCLDLAVADRSLLLLRDGCDLAPCASDVVRGHDLPRLDEEFFSVS